MDLANTIRFYIDKMLKDVHGMKVLLLDPDTTKVVSLVYSQSEILEQEVYLVEKLDSERSERLTHLKVRRLPPLLLARQATATGLLLALCTLHRCDQPRQPEASCTQAVCFLRPTKDNITRLRRELRDPHFAEYHLCACHALCLAVCLAVCRCLVGLPAALGQAVACLTIC